MIRLEEQNETKEKMLFLYLHFHYYADGRLQSGRIERQAVQICGIGRQIL